MVSRRQGPRSRSCLAHGWPVENDEGAEGGRGADLQRWIPSSLKNLGEVCWWRSSAGTLGGFCASATSWSKWHISKASRNQKTSKGEKLPREGTNLVIQSFLLETCTRTMSWYYCTNMTFGDFYRKWRKKGSFLSGEPFQFMEEQFGWKSCWKSCWQPSGKHRHPQYEDDHRCARSARKMVYENAHECRGAPWGPGRFWGLRLSLPVWPCMADCLLKTLFDKNKDGFSACFFQICIMHIYIYTGFLRSHSLLSKIHAISWVGWCILRVIWGHEDIFIAPLTALNLCKLSAFEKRNTKSASINILELSPYVSRSQLVSHHHFFLQQKWHIYIYIYKHREPTSDRWIDTSPKQKKTVKTKKNGIHPWGSTAVLLSKLRP